MNHLSRLNSISSIVLYCIDIDKIVLHMYNAHFSPIPVKSSGNEPPAYWNGEEV